MQISPLCLLPLRIFLPCLLIYAEHGAAARKGQEGDQLLKDLEAAQLQDLEAKETRKLKLLHLKHKFWGTLVSTYTSLYV